MIIERGNKFICLCDRQGCKGILNSEVDIAWKMYEIVFGVDPTIAREIGNVIVTKERFHFCGGCRKSYESTIISLITRFSGKTLNDICTDPHLHKDLGCWITLIDVLGGPPLRNYQIPYDVFHNIYIAFCVAPTNHGGTIIYNV